MSKLLEEFLEKVKGSPLGSLMKENFVMLHNVGCVVQVNTKSRAVRSGMLECLFYSYFCHELSIS